MTIESKFADVLIAKGFSITSVQQWTGIDIVYLSDLRDGNVSNLSLNKVDQLCKVLSCQPADLFIYV